MPRGALPVAAEARDIELVVDGRLRFGAPQIALYESCPRRFFYTHVLQIGGRRTATAFMHLHEAVRSMVEAVIASDVPLTERDLEDRTDAALAGEGLADHGYRAEFRDLALMMLRFFLSNREGAVAEPPVALESHFRRGRDPRSGRTRYWCGRTVSGAVRRIRTGHMRIGRKQGCRRGGADPGGQASLSRRRCGASSTSPTQRRIRSPCRSAS